MAADFRLAPPAKTVDGLLAVPMDIQSVVAAFTFDAAAQTATADATINFEVGPTGGSPIFDLRQTVTQAWLDGAVIPASQLAHHAFGTGAFTDLRVLEPIQAAGSVHTLRLQYGLALPNAQIMGGYLPELRWTAGPRLTFAFGLSDLNRCRYAEAWLPVNLLFDQFSIDLDITLTGTAVDHTVITSGAVTTLGSNHWQIAFPPRSTAHSPLLEIRATATLQGATDTVLLPVSGTTVTLEAWRPVGSATDLPAQIARLKTFLQDNENDYGPYLHGNRFVAFFNGGGGMEYDGGTTTSVEALNHEVFHSWFARGLRPSSQADGWWDEGFTSWHDDGANDADPFDFTDPPIVLSSRDPWQRHTPGNSYADGSAFWRGMAATIGVGVLNSHMASLYTARRGDPTSTEMLEEHLVARSGESQIVDSFHRFVYGFDDASPAPDLWMKDDPGHTGNEQWNGPFWNSPDLWVRNADDDGATHQPPEHGQDNWLYARVRNKPGSGTARHFVVAFRVRGFVGTQFVYPNDYFPATAVTAAFDLSPGGEAIVKARWPAAQVPPEGTHTCLLVAVIARGDHPASGRHVWEDDNLAQKNLTVVDMVADETFLLPVVIGNARGSGEDKFVLEIVQKGIPLDIRLVSRSKVLFEHTDLRLTPFKRTAARERPPVDRLECGAVLWSTRHPLDRFDGGWQTEPLGSARIPVVLPATSQLVVGLALASPFGTKQGDTRIDLVQRHARSDQMVGGITVLAYTSGDRGGER